MDIPIEQEGLEIGTLYVVGLPIGNLEDITLRALRVLKEVDLVAAEDTRSARRILTHHDIRVPVTSCFEHNEQAKLGHILDELQNEGLDVALISEAGMPGLSDPGYRLIKGAIEAGIPVVPIPGPSAVTTALVISGLPTDSFVYLGFLPRKRSARRRLFEEWKDERRTLVAFEAPHRLADCLEDILHTLGDRPMAVAREMTKLFEEVLRGSAREIIAHFQEKPPRGEITLVIGGEVGGGGEAWTESQVRQALERELAEGASKTEAAKAVSQAAGWPRRQVYRMAVGLADGER